MIDYRWLKDIQYDQIADCWDLAFADYFLKSNRSSRVWLENRCIKNGVDLARSVGAFAGDRMIGFTLIGYDRFMGALSAFDAGTGIIPEYRGQGVATQMFEFALCILREEGLERFYLEVLQENKAAIAAYTKAGFAVTRDFDCYTLPLDNDAGEVPADTGVEIKEVDRSVLAEFSQFVDWVPSWEISVASIMRIPDELVTLGAFEGDECVGVIAYYPLLNWIMSIVVRPANRQRGIGSALVSELANRLKGKIDKVNLINVEHTDSVAIGFMTGRGFQIYTRQHEMMHQIESD